MVVPLARADAPQVLAGALRAGGVAVIPCDTIYGLVGAAPATGGRISRIKLRDPGKPLLRLIADESWLPRYTPMSLPQPLRPFWPGPLTIVFPDNAGGTVALRVPADKWLRGLLEDLDFALVSTSVNDEGEPPLGRIAEIIARYESQVDLVVDGGDRIDASPSTVVDVSVTPFRVLRQGALKIPPAAT